MERRREPRLSANQPVQITVLDEKQETLSGRVVNLSGKGMRIVISREFAPGTLLRLDISDAILLGEVSHCCVQDGETHAGVQIEHVLTNLQELARLRDSLLEQSEAPRRVSTGVR